MRLKNARNFGGVRGFARSDPTYVAGVTTTIIVSWTTSLGGISIEQSKTHQTARPYGSSTFSIGQGERSFVWGK
jgi:hypothetical protein